MSMHTPGPWAGIETISDAEGKVICDIAPRTEFKANSTLILAAPEMFEALKQVAELLIAMDVNFSNRAWLDLKAAIAKAEGNGK